MIKITHEIDGQLRADYPNASNMYDNVFEYWKYIIDNKLAFENINNYENFNLYSYFDKVGLVISIIPIFKENDDNDVLSYYYYQYKINNQISFRDEKYVSRFECEQEAFKHAFLYYETELISGLKHKRSVDPAIDTIYCYYKGLVEKDIKTQEEIEFIENNKELMIKYYPELKNKY
jgi:hypothetical protein